NLQLSTSWTGRLPHLIPRRQTSEAAPGMSAMCCHERTWPANTVPIARGPACHAPHRGRAMGARAYGNWRGVETLHNDGFSNRPFGVKRFQTIHHHCSVDVAHELVLLFGIGTRALPSWDSKTRWNNLIGGLAVLQTVGPSGHTNSPHPSSREGHHSTARWSSIFPPIAFDPARLSRCCNFSGPPEFGAVNPDAVHDHRQPARQRHDCLLHPTVPGDLHGPGLDPGPLRRTHQHDLGCFVEHHPHHLVPAL